MQDAYEVKKLKWIYSHHLAPSMSLSSIIAELKIASGLMAVRMVRPDPPALVRTAHREVADPGIALMRSVPTPALVKLSMNMSPHASVPRAPT